MTSRVMVRRAGWQRDMLRFLSRVDTSCSLPVPETAPQGVRSLHDHARATARWCSRPFQRCDPSFQGSQTSFRRFLAGTRIGGHFHHCLHFLATNQIEPANCLIDLRAAERFGLVSQAGQG